MDNGNIVEPLLVDDNAADAKRRRDQIEKFELYRDIALHAPAMLWVSDHHGAMIFVNQQYLQFTGLTEQQAISSESWQNHVHPDDRKRAMSAYTDALTVQRAFSVEYRLRCQDGVYRDVIDLAQPRNNSDGIFAGYIGSTFDIAERKAHEAAILESTRTIEKRSAELKLLYELKSDLQVCREVGETRPVLTKFCEQLFPERSTRILLHNNSRDLVEPFLSWGKDDHDQDMFAPEQCWTLRKGKMHLEQATPVGAICPNAENCGHSTYLCVPMTAFGETIGIMQIDVDEIAPTEASVGVNTEITELARVGAMVADEIAAAIEELKLHAKLHHQSSRDPLTQLYNRRYFIESIERELHRAEHTECELSLLMLDLDQFKIFNDLHGHNGGDLVLRGFSNVLQAAVRGGDVACRYGGEEFAVVMLDCPREGAVKRAEEIRLATEKLVIEHHGSPLKGITTSIGIASYPSDATTLEQLIARADAALYTAKETGRNSICTHMPVA